MWFNTTGKVDGRVAILETLGEDTEFKFIGKKTGFEIKKGANVARVYEYRARFQLEWNSATSTADCVRALNNLFELYGDECADYEFALSKIKAHFPRLSIRDMAIEQCWKFYQHPADGKGTLCFSEYEDVLENVRQLKLVQG